MSNIFLEEEYRDVETAIMLEKAVRVDIENAVAYTNGEKVFINTDENLMQILPDYNPGMLKWLLWHERMHLELKHHNRFFKYLEELSEKETKEKFQVTKSEVNIIMDILVHDSLSRMFPELIETAMNNLAQMRNRNSLGYTFKTHNLEDMLDEYAKYKNSEDSKDSSDTTEDSEDSKDTTEDSKDTTEDSKDTTEDSVGTKAPASKSEHSDAADSSPEEKNATSSPDEEESEQPDEHDKTDWSKLEEIDNREFISDEEADRLENAANKLRNKKLNLARLTQKLNGLATTTKQRTYRMPSYIHIDKGTILKGRMPGKTDLYLIFDASGSMGGELTLFKELIKNAIPQAMECPCEWFAGYEPDRDYSKESKFANRTDKHPDRYYKGKFKDIFSVHAAGGYWDDGDRTIELCLEAEKNGYTPIGVTDGGGKISEPEVLKQLKRTIFVGHDEEWLKDAKAINPYIQTLFVE